MKNLALFLVSVLLFSCSAQKSIDEKKEENPLSNNLTETESNIVSEFLNAELAKEKYKNYLKYEIFVIQEATSQSKSLETYLYALNEWKFLNKVNKIDDLEGRFFFDTIQIKDLKLGLEKEEVYQWKKSDFKNIKIGFYKYEELRKIINTGAYISLPKRLIISLSKPLVIDKNNALISFDIGNGALGNSEITHFTVLMKKVNNKWEEKAYYNDGVFY